MMRVVIMLFLPLAIVLNWPHHRSQEAFWGGRAVAVGVVLAFIYQYTRAKHLIPVDASHRRRDIVPLNRPLAYELLREAGRDPVNRTQATLFSMAVRTPSMVRQRVTEEYVPGQSTLRQKVTVELQVPRI